MKTERQAVFKGFPDMIKQPYLAGAKGEEIVNGRDEKVSIDKDQIMEDHKCQAEEVFGLELSIEGPLNIFMYLSDGSHVWFRKINVSRVQDKLDEKIENASEGGCCSLGENI